MQKGNRICGCLFVLSFLKNHLDDKIFLINIVNFIWTFYHINLVYLDDTDFNCLFLKSGHGLMERRGATPVGTGRAEDPGLS